VNSTAPATTRFARGALLVVTIFNALSALTGGAAILTGWLRMPQSLLESSPFDSFFWPGIILVIIVGGTQTVAAVLLLRRSGSSLAWAAVAGFGMTIWIFVETGIIAGLSWLQVLYFATGTIQLVLVLAQLGVVKRIVTARA
jgi:hypothetical protein